MDKSGVFDSTAAEYGVDALDTPVGEKAGTVEDIQNMQRLGKEQVFRVGSSSSHLELPNPPTCRMLTKTAEELLLHLDHGIFPYSHGHLGDSSRHHSLWSR